MARFGAQRSQKNGHPLGRRVPLRLGRDWVVRGRPLGHLVLAAKMGRVDVREVVGNGGGGERHNQGNGDEKLLHRGLS